MAIRNLRYKGDEILKKKSREIETIDEKLQTLIDDMIETMHKYNGVGLAAVQVGILSFPNEFAKVIRPTEVTAEYTDRDGKRIKVKAKELLAQAICHEVDHLNGEVFIDKIIPGTLEYIEPTDEK